MLSGKIVAYLLDNLANDVMKQIYISHTKRDRRHMEKLREYLKQAGYRPRINRGMTQGKTWDLGLVDTIRSSDIVIPILTEDGAGSLDVTYEWSLALGSGVPVYPILFRGVNAHPHLMILPMYDFGAYTDENRAWEQFMRELQRVLGDEVSIVKMDAGPQNPPQHSTVNLSSAPHPMREPKPPPKQEPAKAAGFYLVVELGDNPPQEYRLEQSSISLGRDAENDIQINDHGVSRSHLRFIRGDGGYRAMDLGSTNGTFDISGERITSVALKPNDVLKIGSHIVLTYKYMD